MPRFRALDGVPMDSEIWHSSLEKQLCITRSMDVYVSDEPVSRKTGVEKIKVI